MSTGPTIARICCSSAALAVSSSFTAVSPSFFTCSGVNRAMARSRSAM